MSKMRLHSSIVTALEILPPEEVLAPACALPDSFDFLALPEEIRMYVYKYCLVSDTEISLDPCRNMYYVINYGTSYYGTRDVSPDATPPPPITVKVPANFSYPSSTDSPVIFVPPAPSGFADQSTGPQIIPLTSVVESENLNYWPMESEYAKNPFDQDGGIYIGPIRRERFSYLPPCSYTPFASFNARLLQTCKKVYAEALPVLYRKNRFALHNLFSPDYFLRYLTGRALEHITNLRFEVRFIDSILDKGGINSMWNFILRYCTQLRKVTISFADGYHPRINYFRAMVRIGASIADIRKGTDEPVMTVKANLADNFTMPDHEYYWVMKYVTKHPKMRVPRGVTIELMGEICVPHLPVVQKYSKNGWRFERRSPENDCDIKAGSWVELAWVKSRA